MLVLARVFYYFPLTWNYFVITCRKVVIHKIFLSINLFMTFGQIHIKFIFK